MIDRLFTRISSAAAQAAGQPWAFIAALAVVLVWVVTGPVFHYSDTWQLVINTGTTIITFLMVFIIQNSQNRDSAALQAKLDELIRAVEGARSGFIGIEHLTDREIEQLRRNLEREEGGSECDESVDETLRRLAERR